MAKAAQDVRVRTYQNRKEVTWVQVTLSISAAKKLVSGSDAGDEVFDDIAAKLKALPDMAVAKKTKAKK